MYQSTKIIPIVIRKLKRVKLRLPPAHLFDELLWYLGNRRFFALCWSHADQAPILNDGFFESVGVPDAYRVWRYHPVVIATLAGYNIGDAAIVADHLLLVDRLSRALYVGKVWDVVEVLEFQKSGISEPLHEAGPDCNSGNSEGMQEDSPVAPGRSCKKTINSNTRLLNELEAWLNSNSMGG